MHKGISNGGLSTSSAYRSLNSSSAVCASCGGHGHNQRVCPSYGGSGKDANQIGNGQVGNALESLVSLPAPSTMMMNRAQPTQQTFGFQPLQNGGGDRRSPERNGGGGRPSFGAGGFRGGRGGGGDYGGARPRTTNRGDGGGGGDLCYRCHQPGHFSRECTAQLICNRCKRTGHSTPDCPLNSGGKQSRGGRQDGEHTMRIGGATKYEPLTPSAHELFEHSIDVGQNYDNLLDLPVQRSDTDASGSSIGDVKPIQLFAEAKLDERVYTNVKHSGYEAPTPIQRYAIPLVLAERDIMACAQTGSGKTAAYLVPMASMLLTDCPPAGGPRDGHAPSPLALIFAPTRELVKQIWWETLKFADGTRLKSMAVYGGTNVQSEVDQLRSGPEIVVATPGRLIHLVRDGHLSLDALKFLVLDEADRMLDMGFEPEIRLLVQQYMPKKHVRQTLMFSATFPTEIQHLASDFLRDFVLISVGIMGSANQDIRQEFEQVPKQQKSRKLLEYLNRDLTYYQSDEQGRYYMKTLVFVERKRNADFIASFLSQNDLKATSIHGDREQREREEALDDFRQGRCPILVATAVAARGLDIKGVDHVINYDLPQEIEDYVHRIGRTGRVGNPGRATSFYDPDVDRVLAAPLVKILVDAFQEVPEWLQVDAKRHPLPTPSISSAARSAPPTASVTCNPSDDWGDEGTVQVFDAKN